MADDVVFCCKACYDADRGTFELVKTVFERNDDGSERLATFDCPECGERCGFVFRGEEATV